MNKNFWKNKNVLITGHTGFQGSWLTLWLQRVGANLTGLSIDSGFTKGIYNLTGVSKSIVDWRGDIADLDTVRKVFNQSDFDVVFHLAAQASAKESLDNPVETYESNVIGTLNLLETIKEQERKIAGVFITTDTLYENCHSLWSSRETDSLGGEDPFSSSKACCEILINSYRKSFFKYNDKDAFSKSIGSARTGYVIGGGDWTEGRILPDLMRAYEKKAGVSLKGADTLVPCLHVLDALNGYLTLAENLYTNPELNCEAFNFGPDLQFTPSLKGIAEGINECIYDAIDFDLADLSDSFILKSPCLDITKSRINLGWTPALSFPEALTLTLDWYVNYRTSNVLDLCLKEIDIFMEKLCYETTTLDDVQETFQPLNPNI